MTFRDCKVSFHILLYKKIIDNNIVALLFMYTIQCTLYEENIMGCCLRVNKEAGKRWKLKIDIEHYEQFQHGFMYQNRIIHANMVKAVHVYAFDTWLSV